MKLYKGEPQICNLYFTGFYAFLREIYASSMLFMGIQGSVVIMGILPSFLIAHHSGLIESGAFSTLYRIVLLPLSLLGTILPIYWSAFTIAWTRGNKKWITSKLIKSSLLSLFASGLFTLGLIFCGNFIMTLWLKGSSFSFSKKIYLVLGIWMISQMIVNWISIFLHSIADFRFEFFCYSLCPIVFIFLSKFIFSTDTFGISLSMLVSIVFSNLLPMVIRAYTKLRI